MKELFDIARDYIRKASQAQAKYYNLKWRETNYLSCAAENFAAKLTPKFDGSYAATNFDSPIVIVVESSNGKTIKKSPKKKTGKKIFLKVYI